METYHGAGQPQTTIWRMCIACRHLQLHTHTHTLKINNTYRFSTATMVTAMHLNVTLYIHCLSCQTFTSFVITEYLYCYPAYNTFFIDHDNSKNIWPKTQQHKKEVKCSKFIHQSKSQFGDIFCPSVSFFLFCN